MVAPLIGDSNETVIVLSGLTCRGLIDTGSMVTTVCESLFESVVPRPELLNLSDFSLDIVGANDSTVPYIGYCLLELAVPIIGHMS